MGNKGGFKGIWIPREIVDLDIGPLDKMILSEIHALDDGDGCRIRNAQLAKILNVHPQTIRKRISLLRKNEYVKWLRFDGKKRYLRCCIEIVQSKQIALSENKQNA